MTNPTLPVPQQQPTPQPVDDPFGGSPENWSLPDNDWPPSDPWEMAQLDAWMDDREREYFDRCGNGDED